MNWRSSISHRAKLWEIACYGVCRAVRFRCSKVTLLLKTRDLSAARQLAGIASAIPDYSPSYPIRDWVINFNPFPSGSLRTSQDVSKYMVARVFPVYAGQYGRAL
jgi:hypothetical protein